MNSFLHVKECLFTNICCWTVEMQACSSQFCWTCLSPFWELSNTTSLTFAATGRRHHTGVHEYYSLAATGMPPQWLERPCQHTGHAHLNRSCGFAKLAWSTAPRYSHCMFHSQAQLPEVLLHLQLPDKTLQKSEVEHFTLHLVWLHVISIYKSATTWLLKSFRLYEPGLIK